MKTLNFTLIFLVITICVLGQKTIAYRIFTGKGKIVSADKMMKNLEKADIILFGEYHNNPISHWLEYEVSNYLSDKYKIILGAEMFETDNQEFLTKYINGDIDRSAFDTLVRLWSNYNTDYAPLVKLAKLKKIDFIATNVPRRYAAMVNKNGFAILDSLPENEKAYIAPLPIEFDPELPGYKKMIGMMMPGHNFQNLPKAQALKDATMAWNIYKNYKQGYKFIHFNGAYHSDNYEGILWYLKKLNPNLKYITISTVSQTDVSKLKNENKNIADFIICVNKNMTTTYKVLTI